MLITRRGRPARFGFGRPSTVPQTLRASRALRGTSSFTFLQVLPVATHASGGHRTSPLTPSRSYFFGHGALTLTGTVSPLRNFNSALTGNPPLAHFLGSVP